MKVVFNMNRAQLIRAQLHVTAAAERSKEIPAEKLGQYFDAGNVLGWRINDGIFANTEVELMLVGSRLTFDGARTALRLPDITGVLENILNYQLAKLPMAAIFNYETTDRRMWWYETLPETLERLYPTKERCIWALYNTPWRKELEEHANKFVDKKLQMPLVGSPEYRRADASGELEAIKKNEQMKLHIEIAKKRDYDEKHSLEQAA